MPPELPAIPAPWPCQLVQSPPSEENRGRYVLLTEGVPPGSAVLEDQPYAAVAADPHRGYCCAYCITLCSTRVLQCGGCKQAHYCSEVRSCLLESSPHTRKESMYKDGVSHP